MTPDAGTGPASTRLARAVAATSWRELPPAIRSQACDLFLDTLAVTAAAAADASHARWARSVAVEPGACTLVGFDACVPAGVAALVNAGATTVLQWQDGHRRGRGHPASHLVPALLAIAEPRGASSEAVLSAFVGGYECAARVGIALGGLQDGLHDAGTWPTIGTAAACARLLGADVAGIAAAIDGAACIAPQPYRETARRGDGVHHLYMGHGALAALDAARGAVAGLGSPPGALEDFYGPRAGAAFDPAQLCAGVAPEGSWTRYELPEAYLKWHPVCAHFSGVADALEVLLRDASPRPALQDVAAVEVATYGAGLDYQNPDPRTALAARFSIPAIVYASIATGGLRGPALALIADPAHPDRAWLQRVHVVHDPGLDAGYPAGRPARVTLQLRDGTRASVQVVDAYGDSHRPLPREARDAKVLAAFASVLGEAGARRACEAFAAWVAGAPLAALTRALRPGR